MPLVRSDRVRLPTLTPPVAVSQPEQSETGSRKRERPALLPLLAVLAVYIGIRVAYWGSLTHIEEHDSVGYLFGIQELLDQGVAGLGRISPDHGLVFPVISAIFGWLWGSAETGARLSSLVMQIGLFFAAAGIGRRLMPPRPLLLGLLLLALSPVLITLSVRVVTEPVYIGIVYLGLWLFWAQYASPRWWSGALLGLVFGLSFLTRVEGLLFLLAVPFFQAVHYGFARARAYDAAGLLRWGAAFVLVFGVLGTAEVWRVSQLMGGWALNGRQAWAALYAGGENYEQAIYGLDFDPARTNLQVARSDPAIRSQLQSDFAPAALAKLAVRNLDEIHTRLLGELVGPLVLVLFAFGMLGLVRERRYLASFLIVAFILTALVLPLLQSMLVLRHLAVLVPILLLVAAQGIFTAADAFWPGRGNHRLGRLLPIGGFVLVLGSWLVPLRAAFPSAPGSADYDALALAQPAAMVRASAGVETGARPRVAARRMYFAWLAGAEPLPLPYTDYQGLVEYLRLNAADFLLLDHSQFHGRPFAESFQQSEAAPDFVLLSRTYDAAGRLIELYRFAPGPPGVGPFLQPRP